MNSTVNVIFILGFKSRPGTALEKAGFLNFWRCYKPCISNKLLIRTTPTCSKLYFKSCVTRHCSVVVAVNLWCWVPRGNHQCVHSMPPDWGILSSAEDFSLWVFGRWRACNGYQYEWICSEYTINSGFLRQNNVFNFCCMLS